MRTEIIGHHAFQSCRVVMEQGEHFVSEAGKMVRMSTEIDVDVTTKKNSGGLLGGLKRLLGGDSFFFSTYTARANDVEVVLGPILPGNIGLLDLDGSNGWYTAGGSYMASGPNIGTEPKWQGMKGLFSGENLVFVHCTGTGPVVLDAFGVIWEEQVDGTFIVDTGHVVAFEDTLDYEITKVGGSWLTSFLAGEGFVINFKGSGRVMVQSHNRNEFGRSLGPMLPPRG
ncbi:MAG: TIGR00266 family protein [Candidatus Eremiobacteraeota bacterium]|nr:TIGR00266 family protein [Candidatus Eremiobacteraeota bacterium]